MCTSNENIEKHFKNAKIIGKVNGLKTKDADSI